MKALLINGSPRPNGCTFTALTELANTLEAEALKPRSSMWATRTSGAASPAAAATAPAPTSASLMILSTK